MSLFEMEPTAAWEVGDVVDVQTMWGTMKCIVLGQESREGFPCLRVQPESTVLAAPHDPFLVDVARCTPIRSVGG